MRPGDCATHEDMGWALTACSVEDKGARAHARNKGRHAEPDEGMTWHR